MILSSPDELGCIPKRIISLVPSQTELLSYLDVEKETIAITKFCVHPSAWFRTKQRIGGTKAIHIETIKSLAPDLIIANKEENVKEQVEALAEIFPVWVTDVNNLADALQMISDIGRLVNKERKAITLVNKIQKSFDKPDAARRKIPAAYFIWKDPYMTIGGDTFISNMMEAAGLQNIFALSERYPEINISDVKSHNCELLLLSSEPYPFVQKHVDELAPLLPGIKILLADGEMFSWYGSRLLEAPAYFKKLVGRLK